MIKKFKTLIFSLVAAATILAPAAFVTVPAFAAADISGGLCTGSNFTISSSGDSSCSNDTASNQGINTLLQNIVNIFSAIVGVIAVIMIVFGGLRYITSGGDSNKISAAKNTLIYAIIGLVIVALAQLIVHFVLAKASSVATR